MPPPETDEERRDRLDEEALRVSRELAELKARQGRLELGAALLLVLGIVIWALFFRSAPVRAPGPRPAMVRQWASAVAQLPQKPLFPGG